MQLQIFLLLSRKKIMPHAIDFDGLERKLFLLQHVAYGSLHFCGSIELTRDGNYGDYEWWEYKGLLKSFVSNTTIESAIKVRILLDFIKSDEHEIDLIGLDSQVREGLSIGQFIGDNQELSLRESCNKIVHATEAMLQWAEDEKGKESSFDYWNGKYSLWGELNQNKWEIELCIISWCTAMIRFNKEIQETIDWYRVFKHDE